MTSLLPPNASALDRKTETVMAGIEEIPMAIRDIFSAESCPADFLPFLAWAMSVDYWNEDWSDTVKRRVIAGSFAWHRIKGTEGAVRQALASLGATVDITEWWQMDPPGVPHTFSVAVWANENLQPGEPVITDGLAADMQKAIEASKPVRSHYVMTLGARFDGELAAGSAATAQAISRMPAAATAPVGIAGQVVLGPAVSVLSISGHSAEAVTPIHLQLSAHAACAVQVLTIHRTEMETIQ